MANPRRKKDDTPYFWGETHLKAWLRIFPSAYATEPQTLERSSWAIAKPHTAKGRRYEKIEFQGTVDGDHDMKHKALLAGLALAAAALMGQQAQAATNLITNPGFETGDLTGYTETGNYTGYDGVTMGNDAGGPHSGSYLLELGSYAGSGPAGVTQTLSTVAGQDYTFSLYLANGANNAPGDQLFDVTYNGSTLYSLDGETAFPYKLLSFIVVGTGSDTIGVSGYSDGTYNDVDDLSFVASAGSVSAAPEPSTWALMIAGIGGIGLMLRRARKTMGFRFKDAFGA